MNYVREYYGRWAQKLFLLASWVSTQQIRSVCPFQEIGKTRVHFSVFTNKHHVFSLQVQSRPQQFLLSGPSSIPMLVVYRPSVTSDNNNLLSFFLLIPSFDSPFPSSASCYYSHAVPQAQSSIAPKVGEYVLASKLLKEAWMLLCLALHLHSNYPNLEGGTVRQGIYSLNEKERSGKLLSVRRWKLRTVHINFCCVIVYRGNFRLSLDQYAGRWLRWHVET
jgi:hypothetical protein